MKPDEAAFGKPPLSLLDYVIGSTTVTFVEELLKAMLHVLCTYKLNLERAKTRMHNMANAKHTDVVFNDGNWVFVKLQPHHQSSSLTVGPTNFL